MGLQLWLNVAYGKQYFYANDPKSLTRYRKENDFAYYGEISFVQRSSTILVVAYLSKLPLAHV